MMPLSTRVSIWISEWAEGCVKSLLLQADSIILITHPRSLMSIVYASKYTECISLVKCAHDTFIAGEYAHSWREKLKSSHF